MDVTEIANANAGVWGGQVSNVSNSSLVCYPRSSFPLDDNPYL